MFSLLFVYVKMMQESSFGDLVREHGEKDEESEEVSDGYGDGEFPDPPPDVASDVEERRHVVRPPVEDDVMTQVSGLVHDTHISPFEDETNRIAVLRTDMCNPDAFDVDAFHNKILTETDIGRLFSGQSSVTRTIRDCINRNFIVLVKRTEKKDSEVLCELLITGTLHSVLKELEIKFMLEVLYPDSTSRFLELRCDLDRDEGKVFFRPAEGVEVMCVTDHVRDILIMNLRYSQGKNTRKSHRLTKTALVVGEYGYKVKLDDVTLKNAMKRIAQQWESKAEWKGVPGATLLNYVDPAGKAQRERESALSKTQKRTAAGEGSSQNGWTPVPVSVKSLNCIIENWMSIVRADILVNFDDTLIQAEQEAAQRVRLDIQVRQYRYTQAAANRIVQNSEFENTEEEMSAEEEEDGMVAEFRDRKGAFYHVDNRVRKNRLEHVGTMNSTQSDAPDSETEASVRHFSLLDCYFIVHKYRKMFNQTAFPHIEIPADITKVFLQNKYQTDIVKSHERHRELQFQSVLGILLDNEREHLISRRVKLRNLEFELRSDMVLASFQAMLDRDVYDKIMANVANEAHARDIAKPAKKNRVFGMCSGWCGE